MKTCYLHIGHAKTGTSFLQNIMHTNDLAFEDAGIFVPWDYRPFKSWNCRQLVAHNTNFAGNLAPVFHAISEGNAEKAGQLLDYIFAGDRDVLLSTELVFYYALVLRKIIAKANERGFRVIVLAYVQRQDRAAIPSYYQNIRNHGYAKPPLSFLQETMGSRYFRYFDVLADYAIAEPNQLILRTFETEFFPDQDLVADFVAALGIAIDPEDFIRPDKQINASLGLESLEVIRGLNLLQRPDLVNTVIANAPPGAPGSSRRSRDYYYTRHVAQFIQKEFMPANPKLVETYLSDRSEAERAYWLAPPDMPSGKNILDVTGIAATLALILREAPAPKAPVAEIPSANA